MTKLKSITKNKLILLLLILSAGLINLSLIPGSKIQVFIYLIVLLIFVDMNILKNNVKLDISDFLFVGSVFFLMLPSFVNASDLSVKSLTQPIYLMLYWLIYKILQAWLSHSKISGDALLKLYFKATTIVIGTSLIFFLVGFLYPSIARSSVELFNNANTFDLGGIAVGQGNWLPRLSGFSPEPSFWSLYIAVNLGVYFQITHLPYRYIYIIVNIVSLVVTFGRTGYFAFFGLMIYVSIKKFPTISILTICSLFIGLVISFNNDYIFQYMDMSDASIVQRFDSLIFSFEMWAKFPFIGNGLGNFTGYALMHGKDYRDIFSLYFNLLFSGGLLGLTLFIFFLLSFFKNKKPNYILVTIMLGWCVMPAFNLPFIWCLLAIISSKQIISRGNFYA